MATIKFGRNFGDFFHRTADTGGCDPTGCESRAEVGC